MTWLVSVFLHCDDKVSFVWCGVYETSTYTSRGYTTLWAPVISILRARVEHVGYARVTEASAQSTRQSCTKRRQLLRRRRRLGLDGHGVHQVRSLNVAGSPGEHIHMDRPNEEGRDLGFQHVQTTLLTTNTRLAFSALPRRRHVHPTQVSLHGTLDTCSAR